MNPAPIDIVSQGIIRVFIHPNPNKTPIDFNVRLKRAKNILLTCPDADILSAHSKQICEFINLFPKKGLMILLPGIESYDPENYRLQLLINHPISFSDLPKHNLWHILRSANLKQLSLRRFDLLVDLDPDFSLLNIYLCRLLRAPLRMSFSKPYSRAFYNFEYETRDVPYGKKLESLHQFLKPFLRTKTN